MISSLNDVYNVGTFVQITEMHDLGDKIRMIIQGHRRLVRSVLQNELQHLTLHVSHNKNQDTGTS